METNSQIFVVVVVDLTRVNESLVEAMHIAKKYEKKWYAIVMLFENSIRYQKKSLN